MVRRLCPAKLNKEPPNTACTGQGRAVGRTFGVAAPTAGSASSGFVRQFPPLPVTPAVERTVLE